ncbi:hypothetical protein HOK51_10945 [Candidatus Woesearchaeota archaeon]|jgi:hypothetical protein|nr:hypothetical protein [Candidatus Woesearchaeota archaeon]MBT6520338.1 hypothetical protein [Candidatus Woesearchaeota archaeon]MBT7368291.1 hypothetical protein [Candidatus Woesearchaeota archaeon]
MDARKYLVQWLIRYLQNRDLMLKRIKKIEEQGEQVIVEQTDKTTCYYIEPFSSEFIESIQKLESDEFSNKALVVYNTKENFKELLKHWDRLIEIKNLIIFFANPFSRLDKKWMVFPKTHHMISGGEIKEGLNSLFLTVEETTIKEIEKIVSD